MFSIFFCLISEALCSRRRRDDGDYTTPNTFKQGSQTLAGSTFGKPHPTQQIQGNKPLSNNYPITIQPVNVPCTCGATTGRVHPLNQRPTHKPYCQTMIYAPGRGLKKPTPCDSSSGENRRAQNGQQEPLKPSNGFTTYPPRPNTHTHGGTLQGPMASNPNVKDPEPSNESYYVPSALPGHVNNPRSHRSRPHWHGSTFGRQLPMTVLGRVEETDDISDSSSTTTSGSFDIDGDGCSDSSKATVLRASHTPSKASTTHSFV